VNSTEGSERTHKHTEQQFTFLEVMNGSERCLNPDDDEQSPVEPAPWCRTFDNEGGLSLEVLGGEFDLSGFAQLDVSHGYTVNFIICLQHHL